MMGSLVALVVDTDAAELRRTAQVLDAAGFIVMKAESFAEAKALLASMTPEIVVADVQLHAFNGLHLAALCAIWRPGMPFVATHARYDSVIEADAGRLSATYVVKTLGRDEVSRAAVDLLASRPRRTADVRRSYRKPAPVQTIAEVAASSAAVIDVSYGGVRLKLEAPPSTHSKEGPPPAFDVVFPQIDLSLHAACVWVSPDNAAGAWECGLDVSENEWGHLQRWRDFVDSCVLATS